MAMRSGGPDTARPGSLVPPRADAAARRARALEQAGDDEGAAEELGGAVAAFGPVAALAQPLADLLERLGRWDELEGLCRAATASCTDAREAAGWQMRRGRACEALGDTEKAVLSYGASLAARPRHLPAIEGLQRLHRARGDWPALARALEEALSLCAGSEEIPLRLELAQIQELWLGQPRDALVHLHRAVDLDPGCAPTLTRALALAETLGAYAEQVSLLEVALERSGDPAERAQILTRQAALLSGPLENPAAAAPRWREALRHAPALASAHDGLRSTLEQLGDWQGLLACLLDASHVVGAATRRPLLERAAQVASERLGPDAALPWLERIRAASPGDPGIASRIAALHRSAGRQGALLASLESGLAAGPAPADARTLEAERDALLAAMAPAPRPVAPHLARSGWTPAEEPASQATATTARRRPAGTAATRAVSSTAGSAASARAAAPKTARDAAAAQAAERELARLDVHAAVYTERRRALARELAHLYADSLADSQRALPHLRLLASADHGVAAAMAEREWAEDRLFAILRAEGEATELAERLAARLARRPDDAAKWLELAELHERELLAPAAAARAYREALARGAPRAASLQGLRRASQALGDWSEVARTLEAEAAEHDTPALRAPLLRTLGEIAWRQLGETTRASRAFAAALENDPHDLVSLRALRQLLVSMEDWRGALDLLESEIELLSRDAGDARRALWLRAAEIAAERLHDFGRAVRALDAAAAIASLDRSERRRLIDCLWSAGALARYTEEAAALHDEAGATPSAGEALRLARALLAVGRLDEARTRCKQALTADPQTAAGWELLAEIRGAQGAVSDAAESLVRAAENATPRPAVQHLLRAAGLVETSDPVYAHALRVQACERDPGCEAASADRAASALTLGRLDEAADAAAHAIELALATGSRESAEALTGTALAVAARAREAGLVVAAARLLEDAALLVPDCCEVLHARAELLFDLGDVQGAHRVARELLARDEAAGKDARLVLIDAEGLACSGALDEAAARFGDAAKLDPTLGRAWTGLASVLERTGRPTLALEALDDWTRSVPSEASIPARLRAAQLVLARGESAAAEARLRELLRLEPGCIPAARLLAEHLLETSRHDAALAVTSTVCAQAASAPERAALARLRAAALEGLGDVSGACAAWSSVLDADPDAADAALARAAWLRSEAAWHDAATGLEDFLERSPAAAAGPLAQVWLELAQLRAGPLADPDGARTAFEACLRLRPGLFSARAGLADLLAGNPAFDQEATARHRELLERTPDRAESLRALVRIAARNGRDDAARAGRAILEALQASGNGVRLPIRVADAPALGHPAWECARQLARTAAREIAQALGASLVLEPPIGEGPVEAFRIAAVVAEADLAGPALVPLRDEEAGAVIATLAALAAERDVVRGDGRLVNALAPRLRRTMRRRLRDVLGNVAPEEIAEIDFRAWRAALRELANAVALDATGGDLGAALTALRAEEMPERTARSSDLLRRAALAFARSAWDEADAER